MGTGSRPAAVCGWDHLVVDTKGLPLFVMVTPADMTDREAALPTPPGSGSRTSDRHSNPTSRSTARCSSKQAHQPMTRQQSLEPTLFDS